MPGSSSSLEIATLLPNAEPFYSQTETFTKFQIFVQCYLPDFPSQGERSDCGSTRSIMFYTLVQTLQHRTPYRLMTCSSGATSGYIWCLDLIVNPCCDRLGFLATDPNMQPQMHHHFALLSATHYLYRIQCRIQITLANNAYIQHHMES